MKALTVLQPWATAIASGKKKVENRGWAPPASLIGQDLAIHAGKAPMDEDDAWFVYRQLFPKCAALNGFVEHDQHFVKWVNATTMGAVVAVVTVRGLMAASTARGHGQADWHQGDGENKAWWLENLRLPAKPIPCRGMQGLWNLPTDVEKAVRESLYVAPVNR